MNLHNFIKDAGLDVGENTPAQIEDYLTELKENYSSEFAEVIENAEIADLMLELVDLDTAKAVKQNSNSTVKATILLHDIKQQLLESAESHLADTLYDIECTDEEELPEYVRAVFESNEIRAINNDR